MATRTVVLSAVVLAAAFTAGEARAETVEVTASGLNVRSGPSTRYRVVTVIRKGQRFNVVARSGSWRKLQVGGTQGWASGSYLRTVSGGSSSGGGAAYTVTASALNVRSGPSTRYRVVGTVRRGQRVTVRGSSGAWRKIAFGGGAAWVHGAYLSRGGGGSTAAPAPAPSGNRPTSRAGFIQLAGSGPGFYGYSIASGRWGRPHMVYGIERVGRQRASERSARIGVGHISRENGGFFAPHVTHREGKNADIRPVRRDGRASPTTIYSSSYSRSGTQRLINQLRAAMNERSILFNDRRTSGTRYYPGHHNHLHFSIR